MKTAILFDLDGTLLDTLGDLHAAVNHVLLQFGYPGRSIEEVCRFVGNGARRLIEQAVPAGEEHRVDHVLAAFQAHYAAHCDILTKPYDGIPEALEVLAARYPLAVVSNKPDRAVKELAKVYFPNLYARGESTDCPRKPAPDMVLKAMEALEAERCVYVGDSDVDILTAKRAGVPCLSVTWGFREEAELRQAGAEFFCHAPKDLPACIEEILRG
jgi:phosphoglycolate phosphatase